MKQTISPPGKLSKQAIVQAERVLRTRYPILAQQDLLGLGLFLFGVLAFILSSTAYYYQLIPAWFCVVLNAFWGSILHEIEHDIFHQQYFKNNKYMQNSMLLVGWLLRPNMLSPWNRRPLHLEHHRHSGTFHDVEERLIGNGLPYGWHRFLLYLDPFFSSLTFLTLGQVQTSLSYKKILFSACTLYSVYLFIWLVVLQAYFLSSPLVAFSPAWISTAEFLWVVYILPSTLRYFCLIFISSTIHYHGGVTQITQQVQVLTHWIFWPLQLFCFNFGATHGIHHLYTPQPFYIRQLLNVQQVYAAMKADGVQFNDLGTFKRKNHYPTTQNHPQQ